MSTGHVSIYEIPLTRIDGDPLDLAQFRGTALLVVNVASRCGLTGQYEGLQRLHERLSVRGLSVLGVPCNQFGEQEPGTAGEIVGFCTREYGVSFPLTAKLEVNGRRRHPLYRALTATADAGGEAGDVEWNFEKFLVSPFGEVVARFRPRVEPEDDELLAAIEAVLPEPARDAWIVKRASEVRPGERVRLSSGTSMTVTRIDRPFLDNEEMLALIEDSSVRWLSRPLKATAEVEVLSQ
jgi:glutathione peroxidase